MKNLSFLLLVLLALLPYNPAFARAQAWRSKVDARLLDAPGAVEAIVSLTRQADLSRVPRLAAQTQKGRFVGQRLQDEAAQSQKPLLAWLADYAQAHPHSHLEYRSLWIVNAIWVRGDAALLTALAQRGDVRRIDANPQIPMRLETPEAIPAPAATQVLGWSLSKVGADKVWAEGVTGQGVVVAGQDTGYDWTHTALKSQYRGWNGVSANHDYNWHDAVHSGGGVCGADALAPCDDSGHGTHTMGTMLGDDGSGAPVGMAPDARWIGCRNMNVGVGTPATYLECYQWLLAPTPVGAAGPQRYDLAPQVINNSWSCPPSEGCITPGVLITAVQNIRAAGIVTVHSAGNDGYWGCGSIDAPAAIYDESFTVGNTASDDSINPSSSRGPVTIDGSLRLKPDISAPGTNIYSTYPNNRYTTMTGTSMAGPHVAGLVALMISARPSLAGQVDEIESLIEQNAVPLQNLEQSCSPYPGANVPNTSYGWGRIDAARTVGVLLPHTLAISKTATLAGYLPGGLITYTLSVSDINNLAPSLSLRITDTLPAHTSFVRASGSYSRSGDLVIWTRDNLPGGEVWQVELVVRVDDDYLGEVANTSYLASGAEAPKVYGAPLTLRRLLPIYLPLIRK